MTSNALWCVVRGNPEAIDINLSFILKPLAWCWVRDDKWVRVERRGEDVYHDGHKIVLHLESEQSHKYGVTNGGKGLGRLLRKRFVLHPNIMASLVEADLVPESWKANQQNICFWGAGWININGPHRYQDMVHSWKWIHGEWRHRGLKMGDDCFDNNCPAACEE